MRIIRKYNNENKLNIESTPVQKKSSVIGANVKKTANTN